MVRTDTRSTVTVTGSPGEMPLFARENSLLPLAEPVQGRGEDAGRSTVTQRIKSCRVTTSVVVSPTFSWDPEDYSEHWKPTSADGNATRRDSSATWNTAKKSKPSSPRSNRRI